MKTILQSIKSKFKSSGVRSFLSYMGFPQYGEEMDQKTYDLGKFVVLCVDLNKNQIDEICAKLRKICNCRVDWHYVGGRGVIKTLGDDQMVAAHYYKLREKMQMETVLRKRWESTLE